MPYGFWALNLGPLEEQPVLLTIKPSLQLHLLLLKQNVEAFRRRISLQHLQKIKIKNTS